MAEWISVKDRLPEPFVSVLGHMTNTEPFPSVRECYVVKNGWFFIPALGYHMEVDYWMPLPEPPKENSDKV